MNQRRRGACWIWLASTTVECCPGRRVGLTSVLQAFGYLIGTHALRSAWVPGGRPGTRYLCRSLDVEKALIWPKGALSMPTFTAINGELLIQMLSITMVLPMSSLSAATSR